MILDTKAEIKGANGSPIVYPDKSHATVRSVLTDCLSNRLQNDGGQSRRFFNLIKRLNGMDTVTLNADEVKLLRERVMRHPDHSHYVIGYLLDMLDAPLASSPVEAVKP